MKILLILPVLLIPALSFAESVVLKSGKIIEGPILEQNDLYIRIGTEEGPRYFERKFIREIAPDHDKSGSPADTLLVEALEFAREGSLEKAKIMLEIAKERDPEDEFIAGALELIEEEASGMVSKDLLMALFGGSLAMMKQQYPQARDYFLRALALKPDDPDISFNLASAYYNLKEYQEGIDCLKKTTLAGPDDADAYALLGSLYYDSGQFGLAKENLLIAKGLFKDRGNKYDLREINLLLTALSALDTP
jgi:tetratricopeptide (TPR) repeat protein